METDWGELPARATVLGWASPRPDTETTSRTGVLSGGGVCFNGRMASFQKTTATGRHDLEPFWPSRQHHDFDRVCCRAVNARAL
ncbi:hypothetical protein [Streptomyces sp. NBC_00557]|uniref:hypothetical protein n=1 Tax=Streptomyces sp. NBC_00557 TaxID=2975776 RepID=UPI002E80A6B1|nr:hypothetical protein [Streptomyces sp. NBC_00557]WUC37493.1 hypothetical protein OG956_26380 [Streptomyces sp. NBC_00557]